MRHSILVFYFAVIVTLGGCASLSKEECQKGDWSGIGYRDGSQGKPFNQIDHHKKACAKHKIAPDISAYQAGRQSGLEQVFCKPRNGYRVGLSGRIYQNVCPSLMENDFLAAYHYGRNIYQLKADANSQRNLFVKKESDLLNVEDQIQALGAQIRTYHQHTPRARIKRHIKQEYRQLHHMSEITPAVATNLQLKKISVKALKKAIILASERGNQRNKMAWMKEYSRHFVPRGREHKRMLVIIKNLSQGIEDKIKIIKKLNPDHDIKQSLHFMNIAESAGALESQLEILRSARNRIIVKNLIKFHFAHESEFANRQVDRDLLALQQHKSRQQLEQELIQLEQEKTGILHELNEIEYRLGHIEADIEHLSRENPYL